MTENLWEALRSYRQEDGLVILWVDAVCIDQANIQERFEQVLLMRGIYSESKRVLIWLGPKSLSDRRVFKSILRTNHLAVGADLDDREALNDLFFPLRNDEDQDALTDLFAKSWFSRVWIFQKIICAAEATVTSGSCHLDFDHVHRFCLLWSSQHG